MKERIPLNAKMEQLVISLQEALHSANYPSVRCSILLQEKVKGLLGVVRDERTFLATYCPFVSCYSLNYSH